VVAAADGGSGDAGGAGQVDGGLHGEVGADLAHAVAPLHHQAGAELPDQARPAAGVHSAVL
jgi:hypothetical protein